MKKQIKFRAQYLYLISEILDNASFFNKKFDKVCFIDNKIFSNKVLKQVRKVYPKLDVLDVDNLKNIDAKKYDLVIAPLSLQFFTSVKYDISILHDSLKPGGVLLASGFNVLSSADSIVDFKNHILEQNLRPSLINFFALGELLNKYQFKDKALDRENLIIEGNKVELINLFCLKKEQYGKENSIKIDIF